MSVIEAVMQMAEYFNEGDGRNADQETKDSFNAIRDFVTVMLGTVISENNKEHA